MTEIHYLKDSDALFSCSSAQCLY